MARKHNCPQCSYSSDSVSKVQFHLQTHVEGVLFFCNKCQFTASTSRVLEGHKRRNHGNDSEPEPDPELEDKEPIPSTSTSVPLLSTPPTTKRHTSSSRSTATEEQPAPVARRRTVLNTLRSTSRSRNATTGKTDTVDPESQKIRKPIARRVTVGGQIKYQCSFCPYKSARNYDVEKHERIHTGEKPYECRFCDYASATATARLIHEYNKHGQVRKSNSKICKPKKAVQEPEPEPEPEPVKVRANTTTSKVSIRGKRKVLRTARNASASVTARKIVASSRRRMKAVAAKFKCSYCPFVSTTEAVVRRHEPIHTGVKHLTCDHCSYSTHRMDSLRAHLKVHGVTQGTSRRRRRGDHGESQRSIKAGRRSHLHSSVNDNDDETSSSTDSSSRESSPSPSATPVASVDTDKVTERAPMSKHESILATSLSSLERLMKNSHLNLNLVSTLLLRNTPPKPPPVPRRKTFFIPLVFKDIQATPPFNSPTRRSTSDEDEDNEYDISNHTVHQCPKCNFKTHAKSMMKRHSLVHSDVKTYKCSFCPYRTVRKYDVARHEKIHTG